MIFTNSKTIRELHDATDEWVQKQDHFSDTPAAKAALLRRWQPPHSVTYLQMALPAIWALSIVFLLSGADLPTSGRKSALPVAAILLALTLVFALQRCMKSSGLRVLTRGDTLPGVLVRLWVASGMIVFISVVPSLSFISISASFLLGSILGNLLTEELQARRRVAEAVVRNADGSIDVMASWTNIEPLIH